MLRSDNCEDIPYLGLSQYIGVNTLSKIAVPGNCDYSGQVKALSVDFMNGEMPFELCSNSVPMGQVYTVYRS
jgi:hypothetical protein